MQTFIAYYNAYAIEITGGCCGFMFVVAMYLLFISKGEKAAAVPGLAISAGIFFTFLGLALSLQGATGNGVERQFSTLLNGLSTAFWTSVAGMGISIFSRFILASRKGSTPFSDINREVQHVREQIKGVGNDIGLHITNSLKAAMTEYTQIASAKLEESTTHIDKMNQRFADGINQIDASLTRLVSNIQTMTDRANAIVETTHTFTEKTQQLLQESQTLYEQQALWVSDIQHSMESVSVLAPEAKAVFKAINVLNDNYETCITNMEDRVKKNQDIFVSDIDQHTANVIQRIAAFDGEYHNKITTQLEKLDETVKQSFDTVIHYFGNNMVTLAEKQLLVVAETVEQIKSAAQVLHHEKAAIDKLNIDPAPVYPNSSSVTESV